MERHIKTQAVSIDSENLCSEIIRMPIASLLNPGSALSLLEARPLHPGRSGGVSDAHKNSIDACLPSSEYSALIPNESQNISICARLWKSERGIRLPLIDTLIGIPNIDIDISLDSIAYCEFSSFALGVLALV